MSAECLNAFKNKPEQNPFFIEPFSPPTVMYYCLCNPYELPSCRPSCLWYEKQKSQIVKACPFPPDKS